MLRNIRWTPGARRLTLPALTQRTNPGTSTA